MRLMKDFTQKTKKKILIKVVGGTRPQTIKNMRLIKEKYIKVLIKLKKNYIKL